MDYSLEEYLEMLEDLIDKGKTNPFSKRVSIDKRRILEILEDMRLNLPDELRQAQRITDDRDKIIDDAKNKAASIIREGESQAQEMLSEHVLSKQAEAHARAIVDEAKRMARNIRISAFEYVDDMLAVTSDSMRDALMSFTSHFRAVEDDVAKSLDIIYENRQELMNSKG
ncbi:MAG: hypothetical protein LBS62_02240 [Clostridiales bacterium]|jgi:vacuolar-type H+-ATPase subunit H|nr:hypothetical protein [Clostridiales bacterium]